MRIHLNEGWQFSLGEADDFKPVSLPHDWLIANPRQWYQSGVGWYRRALDTSFLRAGQRVFLRFDGVCMNSQLMVNGQKAGVWPNAFTSFEHEITPFLHPEGENTLLLKVDARFPSNRWYTGAGVYRQVTLVVKNACHFVSDGVYVTTHDQDGDWHYEATCEVETGGRPYQLRHELLGPEGPIQPWSPGAPRLYTLRSQLLVDGQVTDSVDTRFGFRALRFDPNDGFAINGERMKLNGVCLHQEFSVTGAAVLPGFIRRQLLALRRMGVNAVRAAHNPPSSLFMDLCDELGMLVISEFADVWQISKTEYDYARVFDAWHKRDVASWVRRDRNRPSIIMWSLGNEIPDTHVDPEKGLALLTRLRDLARQHDPRGQALPTLGSNYMAWENTQLAARQLKLVGYNYAEFLYDQHHARYPDWVIYGSETCSTVQSRGIYHFPLSQPVLSDDDLQTSSLGNSTTSWGARSVDDCIKDDRDRPFSLGQFAWTGQDYLGEPTPYHTKNSYFGMLDTAGLEKDAYFLFQAAWTDEPMVHLFPHWDFSQGQLIDIRVASNQPQVALFLDDEEVGRQQMEGEVTRNWQLPYRPGVLRAQAYDAAGKLVASATQASFGEVVGLQMDEERHDGLTFVTIHAVDEQGRPVHNANNLVHVSVTNGRLLGLDNGDATDYTPYHEPARRLFSGKLVAFVQQEAGKQAQVTARLDNQEVPVRKIELTRQGHQVFARLLPEGAMAQPLHWRLTNAAGVDSVIASFTVEEDGQSIRINPAHDGRVYVRCGVRNGKEHLDLYSAIHVDFKGLGQAVLNPYRFLSAGLTSFSNVALSNGNERGVATLRQGESWVGFEGLDFGAQGGDELSVWLFPLSHDPFHFEVWEGRPDQGGRRLARPLYDLGMVWNTYQPLRFKLSDRIRGLATLCLVFHNKTHVKGFVFHRDERGLAPIAASDHQELYGDSYQVAGGWVKGIGNNTSLAFTGLALGEQGADRLALAYQSYKPRNPVQVQLTGEGGQKRLLLSLPAQAEAGEMAFPLGEVVTGQQDLRLVFLPGCGLDLASLRFLPPDEEPG